MKTLIGLVLVVALTALVPGLAVTKKDSPEVHRTSLRSTTEIHGYPCAKGYAWFYADGRLNRCTVSRETAFGEAKIPDGSIIELRPDGSPKYTMMQHDAEVAGAKCRGGNRTLGPSEGAMTAFYPSGKLEQCWLAGDQVVQGIPCMSAGVFGLFGDGARHHGGANFYESGKLKSCTLAKDFGTQRRGDHLAQAQ